MTINRTVIRLRGECLSAVEAITGQQPTDPTSKLAQRLAGLYILTLTREGDLERLHGELVRFRDSTRADAHTPALA